MRFADVTAIIDQDKNWQVLKTLVEIEFANINKWFDQKELTINTYKTNFINTVSWF